MVLKWIMKMQDLIRNKIKRFLGIDKLIDEINVFKAINEDRYQEMKELEDSIHALQEVLRVGVDVDYYGQSWAVICIEGKPNYVKFIDLHGKDARDIMHWLKRYEYGRRCIDAPNAEIFKMGTLKF